MKRRNTAKVAFKKIKQKILRVICVLGFVLMLCTFGASDWEVITHSTRETISFDRLCIQSFIGLIMFIGGGYIGGLMQ